MKKSAALGISCFGGARDPQVFQYTLRLLVSSLRLAPGGAYAPFRSRRNAPALRRNATSLRSQRFFHKLSVRRLPAIVRLRDSFRRRCTGREWR
ncbi:MAG: hypothetical protein ACREYE_31180 [Gammaproteobacteria bacterium]